MTAIDNLPHAEPEGLSRPDTAKGKLQRIVLQWLLDKEERGEIPTAIRFVFYELEQQGILSKRSMRLDGLPGKRRPDQNLTDAITHLRDIGAIPWDWIVDESRSVTSWRCARTVKAYLADSVELARLDPWVGARRPVLVTESRAVGGVLTRGCAMDYLADVAPTGGQCAGFLVTEVAPLLASPDTRVLYVGDHDDAGNDIEANARRVLERHTGRTFSADTWERVALTDAQLAGLKRRGVRPVEKKDRRYRDGNPHLAYEAEALGQRLLTQIITRRLDQLLPEPLESVQERERREKVAVLRLLRRQK